jgi:fatty-acyl-CoA synthase
MLRYQTLVDALAAAPANKPFATMWRSEDDVQSVSFGEFRRQAGSIAAQIRANDAGEGDTIVLVMPQGITLMAAFVGAMITGAAPAILAYPNFKVDAVKYCAGLRGVTANLRARLVMIDDAFPDNLLTHVTIDESTNLMRGVAPGAIDPSDNDAQASLNHQGIAFIQHSAGTTGQQKAVALSHDAVLRQLRNLSEALEINGQDRIYSWLPLYHDMGLIACFMLPLVYHLPIVMQSPDEWVIQPRTMMELISQYQSTLAWVPNFALQLLARRVRPADRQGLNLSSLRALINCSEPVRGKSIDEFIAAYAPHGFAPTSLHASYAMAENVFAVTQSNIGTSNGPARLWVDLQHLQDGIVTPVAAGATESICLVSSGRCILGNQVRIASSTSETLSDGRIGQILIRSDSLFDGYYNRPDLSAAVLMDGWYHSGDFGFTWKDELYVTGRKKDLIIVAGKNIHPQDVEEIVCDHPQLRDGRAVALGIFNPDLGTEDIVVVAELADEEDIEAAAIERAVRQAVVAELGVAIRALYLKPPRWVVKSTAGKPARSTTRDKLVAEHPELAGLKTNGE